MTNPLKQKLAIVTVTNAFEDVHTSIDRTIASNATLMAKTMTAREQVGISGILVQAEIEGMYADLGLMCEIRRRVIDRHAQMSDLGKLLGLPIYADGGFTKGPATGQIEESEAIAA